MRGYLFFLLIPIAVGGEYFLKNLSSFSTQMQWVIFALFALLIIVIPIYSLSNSKGIDKDDNLEEELEDEFVESKENFEPIEVSKSVEDIDEPKKVENFKEYIKINFSKYYIEPLLAFGLIIGFFLPWMDVIFKKFNLYEILKQNNTGEPLLLWLIIISSAILILTSFFRKDLKLLTLFTGLIPYVLFIAAMVKYGDGKNPFEEMKVLSYGFYVTYFIALVMIVRGLYRIVKEKSILNVTEQKEEKIVPIKIKVKQINVFIAVGIILSFFLPWIDIMFMTLSGYTLWMEGISTYVWLLPLFAFLLIIATLLEDYLFSPIVVGVLPFILLFVEKSNNDINNIFSLLNYGAYLTLFLSLSLLVLTLFRKRFFLIDEDIKYEGD